MAKTDQLYRADARANPMVYIEDSLRRMLSENIDESLNEKAIEIFLVDKDTIWHKGFLNTIIADSLWKLQSKIDIVNVSKIICFLKEYKTNRIDTLSCLDDIKIIELGIL